MFRISYITEENQFMHELKVARSQALTTREMAQIGLFTALIAAGAYIKINIPVAALSHAFYHAVFICPVSRIFAWSPQRCNLCGDLSGGRPFRYSGVCGRWRSCLSDPSQHSDFYWALYLLPGSQESCPPFAREQVLPGICSVPSGG